ncbi:hypothetical protein D1159_16095 [Pseudoflavonifractor sp. 524-17]|uniref:SH3 domain-containing protein n=1 Tax=Pseudoflavonifractor sp. 524-17 TaxID=2304577 RepID=UPI00137B106A|nr:SH3 domain-containing protein [Pseudoflavonifractor sp. 524-17]NCE66058.1 hypothetical protein [Pseudoflavonifractor sp. 524-17]
MSKSGWARRTKVEIAFDGVDITESIQPYLRSLTYTDNEADQADDLQIQLQDREGIWLSQWLEELIAASDTPASEAGGKRYRVTPSVGLNVRAGRGTGEKKLGALACGTVVEVSGIQGGWAAIAYGGKTAYVSAQYLKEAEGSKAAPSASDSGGGMKIQAVIVRENWEGDGGDQVLPCGQFELDAVDASGPPAVVTIKGTSLPFSAPVRQTAKSRAWESYTLSGIANEIAKTNGMVCMYESAADPFYSRLEQLKTSDIDFLSALCRDAGISLKVTNHILVLFDQGAYEAKPPVWAVKYGDGSYLKYKLSSGTADTQYQSCRVSYVDPATGRYISGMAKIEDYNEKSKNNQQLEVTAKVRSAAEAKRLAEKRLRLHNKYAKTAVFTLPGNPSLAAGVTVALEGFGGWDGKYIVSQAKHTVGGSGYTTQIKLRRTLEGY